MKIYAFMIGLSLVAANTNANETSHVDTSSAEQETNSIERWDRNDDDLLVRDEITDPKNFLNAHFDQIDSNDDGKVSKEELSEFYNEDNS